MNTTEVHDFSLPLDEVIEDYAASIEYLLYNPLSESWRVKPTEYRYMSKAMREEIDQEVDESLKLFPRGEATLESIFYFGKHKGKQVEDVIDDHPNYIQWLAEKEVISFDEETYQKLDELGLI